MRYIESALLYVELAAVDFPALCTDLNARINAFGSEFKYSPGKDDSYATLTAHEMQVIVTLKNHALPAEAFQGALDSPLSQPFAGALTDIISRHQQHILISVLPTERSETASRKLENKAQLALMQVAHATTSLLAAAQGPSAVHWRASNQLLTGPQYALLAEDPCPWALFCRARVFAGATANAGERPNGLRILEARTLIGRPIVFAPGHLPMDQAYAAALSFLRHAIDKGAPIADGDTFGPENGPTIQVAHCDPTAEYPQGAFWLTAEDSTAAGMERAVSALLEHTAVRAQSAVSNRKERTRSLAISYMMLVIMPPVGVLLLLSNLIFKPNAGRTGTLAISLTALILLTAAYTFLNVETRTTAALIAPETVSTSVLTD